MKPSSKLKHRRVAQALAVALLLVIAGLVGSIVFFSTTARVFAALAHTVYPGAVYRIPVEEKLIALTMDDGPSAEYTGPILDILREHDAKATFFFISSHVSGNEALVRRVVKEGHEIGHHMKSERKSIDLPQEEFEQCFDEAEQVLREYMPLKWFRPGTGFYNNHMVGYAESKGYRCVLGNLFPVDTDIKSSAFATRFILHGAHPGAIIVLHDGGDRGRRCVETLRVIIPELQAQGYRFVTLSDLAAAAS
jgi:peptidoglycan/xylan/chitin deacetylase (PgdA/CDA1 family)